MAPKYTRLPTEPYPRTPSTPLPPYSTTDDLHTLDIDDDDIPLTPLPSSNPHAADVEHTAPRAPRLLSHPTTTSARARRAQREHLQLLSAFRADSRFNTPPPSKWARAGVIGVMLLLFWVSYVTRRNIWIETGMSMGRSMHEAEEVDPSY